MTNFRLFQTEWVCRRHFRFDERGRKFSKLVENTVGKGEIVHHKQFLLFQQCFQKTCTADTGLPNNKVVDRFNLRAFADNKIYFTEKLKFVLWKIENIIGKRRKCCYQHFSPFLMFSKVPFFRVVRSRDCVVKSFKKRCHCACCEILAWMVSYPWIISTLVVVVSEIWTIILYLLLLKILFSNKGYLLTNNEKVTLKKYLIH